jgi:hypothetical protein
MNLSLDSRQQDLLRRIVEDWISDLKMEIGKTEDFEYRSALKQDKETGIAILEQLDHAAAQRYRSVS